MDICLIVLLLAIKCMYLDASQAIFKEKFDSARLTFGRMSHLIKSNNLGRPIKDIALDLYIPGNLLFLSSEDISTTDKVQSTLIAGKVGHFSYRNGNGKDARFNSLTSLVQINSTFVVVTDAGNNCLRGIYRSSQLVVDYVGLGRNSGFVDGDFSEARFKSPTHMVRGESSWSNKLFVVEKRHNAIRYVDIVQRTVGTVAISTTIPGVITGLLVDPEASDTLLVLGTIYLRKIQLTEDSDQPWAIIFQTNNATGKAVDGSFSEASLLLPFGLASLGSGLFVTGILSTVKERIRVVDTNERRITSVCYSNFWSLTEGFISECNVPSAASMLLANNTIYVGGRQSIYTLEVTYDCTSAKPQIANGVCAGSNTTAQCTCHSGFKIVRGNNTLICTANNRWLGEVPVCERDLYRCTIDPPTVVGATVEEEEFSVRYACLPGYSMIQGDQRLYCSSMNTWLGNEPICQKDIYECTGSPLSVENSVWSGNASFGALTCVDGYKLVGGGQYVCDTNLQWQGSPPICEKEIYECESVPNCIENTLWQGNKSYGSCICLSGYIQITRANQFSCTSQGSWIGEAPTCIPAIYTCPQQPPNVDHATWRGDNSSGNYTCEPGFVSTIDITNLVCSEDLDWIGELPTCVKEIFRCSMEPPNVANGYWKGDNVSQTFTCIAGYEQMRENNSYVYCDSNQMWKWSSGSPPVCIAVQKSLNTCKNLPTWLRVSHNCQYSIIGLVLAATLAFFILLTGILTYLRRRRQHQELKRKRSKTLPRSDNKSNLTKSPSIPSKVTHSPKTDQISSRKTEDKPRRESYSVSHNTLTIGYTANTLSDASSIANSSRSANSSPSTKKKRRNSRRASSKAEKLSNETS